MYNFTPKIADGVCLSALRVMQGVNNLGKGVLTDKFQN